VFFEVTPVLKTLKPGLVRTLALGDISITFEQPIDAESISDWIVVLKQLAISLREIQAPCSREYVLTD
jgi:hypothetical protein